MKPQLQLPGFKGNYTIDSAVNSTSGITDFSLAGLISAFLGITFYIAASLMIAWIFWGIFRYIMAAGNKEALAKAQKHITYAIIGFIFVIAAFLISGFVQEIANQSINPAQKIQNVSEPK